MLTTEKCRQILGPKCHLSDDDVEHLREQLYALADIVTTVFEERRGSDDEQTGTSESKREGNR